MSSLQLFTPFRIGSLELANRVVMAPLTRLRAGHAMVPQPMAATYYSQRAGAGLIITEATDVSRQAHGYAGAPGIYTPEQIAGWSRVTEAVHNRGGKIFVQLWHTGRFSHPALQEGRRLPVAPSAIGLRDTAITYEGELPMVVPRALATDEIPGLIDQFRTASLNAKIAGFDGVEIHSANGYLLDQFLHDSSNQRTDLYGGSIENRARLLFEVVAAAIEVWGPDRVGVRLSPSGTVKDMFDSDPLALFNYVVTTLGGFALAYLHIIEKRQDAAADFRVPGGLGTADFRRIYPGTIISAGGYDKHSANQTIADGTADLVAFGRLFISNPDLVERLAADAPLNPYDRSTFYGGGEHGYIDYPFLHEATREYVPALSA